MPRPTNKQELLDAGLKNFERLAVLVDSFSEQEKLQDFPEGTLNRNIRDVLAHLHHWHLLLFGWYSEGMNGQKPEMPAKGFTWKTTALLNQRIQFLYSEQPLGDVILNLQGSFQAIRNLIEQHTDQELFEKKRYAWTGSTSMGSYLVSNTSSHYDWAYKLIKRATKGW